MDVLVKIFQVEFLPTFFIKVAKSEFDFEHTTLAIGSYVKGSVRN